MMLGKLDMIFAKHLKKYNIKVIPYNDKKMRKYINEIYFLWRLLLVSQYAHSLNNPKAQFDHFVLGVLYTLSEHDIVLMNKVIMKRDPWLKESLPQRKCLCDNHANKLKKTEVSKIIQMETDLDMNMLTFSTSHRTYNTKIVTKGCTRVKNLIFNFNQEMMYQTLLDLGGSTMNVHVKTNSQITGKMIKKYIQMNSTIDFISVNPTKNNIRNAAKVYKRKKGLFY